MRAMASEVSGKPVSAVPDVRSSAERLQQIIRQYYKDINSPVAPQASDVVGLAESLASVLSPLYEDIHLTFSSTRSADGAPRLQSLQAVPRS